MTFLFRVLRLFHFWARPLCNLRTANSHHHGAALGRRVWWRKARTNVPQKLDKTFETCLQQRSKIPANTQNCFGRTAKDPQNRFFFFFFFMVGHHVEQCIKKAKSDLHKPLTMPRKGVEKLPRRGKNASNCLHSVTLLHQNAPK